MPAGTSGPQAVVAPARERCGVAIEDSRPLDWNNAEGKQRIALAQCALGCSLTFCASGSWVCAQRRPEWATRRSTSACVNTKTEISQALRLNVQSDLRCKRWSCLRYFALSVVSPTPATHVIVLAISYV
jgi:hypothetical protein